MSNVETFKIDSKNSEGKLEAFEIKIDHDSEAFKADVALGLNNGLKKDDAFFLARQLNFAKQRITEPLYTDLLFINGGMITINSETPVGADTISYPTMDISGKADLEADGNDDFPFTETQANEELAKFANYNLGYKFTMQDIRRSQMAGGSFNIITRKVLGVRRGIDENLDAIIRNGDPRVGITGFFNNSLVPNVAVTGAVWASKTDQEVVDDVKRAHDAMLDDTNGKEVPNTMTLDVASFSRINPLNLDTQIESIRLKLERELELRIVRVPQTKGIYTGASSGFTLYANDPLKVDAEVPLRLETLPTVVAHGSSVTKATSRIGSVKFYYPKSASYNYGI